MSSGAVAAGCLVPAVPPGHADGLGPFTHPG